MIWFRSANSHTGPQLHRCIRGRTDGSIRLRANLLQKPLALGGASTDEYATYLEKDRTKPTMKQKVRFIFKARDQGATVSAVPPNQAACQRIRLTR